MSFNLATILEESAARHPEKLAIILDDFKMTYEELNDSANRTANLLHGLGVEKGERVGMMLPNIPQFPIIYFGILKAGCIAVPMNTLSKAPEIDHYLSDSECAAFFYWDVSATEAIRGADGAPSVRHRIQVSSGGGTRPNGAVDFLGLMAVQRSEFDTAATGADDVCVLIYTSGTTGRPKGAALTHFSLFEACHMATHLFDFKDDDVIFAALPMFHVFGLSTVVNGTIHGGATLTLLPRFDAGKALEMIQRDRITLFLGVPTMYFAVLHHPERGTYDTTSLRLCVSGGAALPAEVIAAWEGATNTKILEGYGLSESSSAGTFNQLEVGQKPGSVGTPIWGVQVKVFDEVGKEVARGERGEICIKGHPIMKEYWRNPGATAEAIKAGWFHTGDIGYVDEDGFFFIVDRKKEMIIRGGFNVYPREIEEVIYQHPHVAEAAVVGVPDEKFGEEIHAVVASRPGTSVDASELQAFVKERVAAYKYPRRITVLGELPKGPTGKIMKLEIKSAIAAGDGEYVNALASSTHGAS